MPAIQDILSKLWVINIDLEQWNLLLKLSYKCFQSVHCAYGKSLRMLILTSPLFFHLGLLSPVLFMLRIFLVLHATPHLALLKRVVICLTSLSTHVWITRIITFPCLFPILLLAVFKFLGRDQCRSYNIEWM